MALSKDDEQRIRRGVEQFAAAVKKTHGEQIFSRGVAGPHAAPQPRISSAIVAQITQDRFADAGETLAFSTKEEGLQGAGKSLGQCVLAALRRRLCGKAEATKKVNDAIKQAKITEPGLLSVGAASLVAVAIGSLFAGPIAVAAAPVIGGLAYLLLASGVDGFCNWEPATAAQSGQESPESELEPKRKPKPRKKKEKRAGKKR